MIRLGFIFFAAFLMSSVGHAATLAAKKDGVKIFSEAKKSSAPIGTLKKGETVDSSERKGMFWKVKTADGKEGFVQFTKVKRQQGKVSNFGAALKAAASDSRDMDDVKSSRARSAVMGIRGLDENDETSFAGNVQPNLRMVYNMEDRSVSQQKLNRIAELVQSEIEMRIRKSER